MLADDIEDLDQWRCLYKTYGASDDFLQGAGMFMGLTSSIDLSGWDQLIGQALEEI